jgi:hypothetical protein
MGLLYVFPVSLEEKDFVDNVLKLFPNLTWITDKKNSGWMF